MTPLVTGTAKVKYNAALEAATPTDQLPTGHLDSPLRCRNGSASHMTMIKRQGTACVYTHTHKTKSKPPSHDTPWPQLMRVT
jgi:hypothetical protein